MSFILDSTIGLLVVYIGLKLTQVVVRQKQIETLYFGEYGKHFVNILKRKRNQTLLY